MTMHSGPSANPVVVATKRGAFLDVGGGGFARRCARSLLAAIATSPALLVGFPGLASPVEHCFPRDPEAAMTEIAVSLRQLQLELGRCGTSCSSDVANLHGLARVDGYVIDQASSDIILFGPKRKAPELQAPQRADDLVVALRAAAMRYTEVRSNVRYYTAPGVTLDPRPATITALQAAASDSARNENWVDSFCAACRDKQDLRVLGMPYDTSAAMIMAVADYSLKKVLNFDIPVNVAGFESLVAKRRRQAEADLDRGKLKAVMTMSRLWFYPGQVHYREQPGAVALERADVLVRQQRQLADAKGRYRDGGENDPLTAEWTCEVTRLYREIAAAAPESGFDQLAKLMRMFAVAKLIVTQDASRSANLDLGYLLDRHRIAPQKVPREWDGVAHVERIERHGEDAKRRWTVVVNMPSCGGVEFDLKQQVNLKALPDADRVVHAAARRVIASRPSPTAAFWFMRTGLPAPG